MPMKTTQTAAMLAHGDATESSGSDFGFTDDEDDDQYTDTLYDEDGEYDEYDEFSGSGDGGQSWRTPARCFSPVFIRKTGFNENFLSPQRRPSHLEERLQRR